MKKIIITAGLLLITATPLFAGIIGSKHDLTSTGTGSVKDGAQTQVCIFCHVPHNASNTTLLWARGTTGINAANTFKMYSSTTASTALRTATTLLNGSESSWLCLTCHDGTISNMQTNTTGFTTTGTWASGTWETKARIGNAPANNETAADNNGGTLRDDHPINFVYENSYTAKGGASSGLVAKATLEATPGSTSLTVGSSKPFDGSGKMQCNSCHLVHNEGNTAGLLRKPKAGSTICLRCHEK